MKKSFLLVIISFVFFSCEKDYLIPADEVPGWLKEDIKRNEKIIKDSPQLMNSYGAWLRYEWKSEYYFEYHNELSSSSPVPISMNGDSLHISAYNTGTDYYKEKCCRQIVWKAPKYIDSPWK